MMGRSPIEAGVELDLAVAYAIGWCTRPDYPGDWQDEKGRTWPISEFRPSTDLNAAFAAAERVGLFEKAYIGSHHDLWFVGGIFDEMNPEECLCTPALAICAAILGIKDSG